MTLLQRLERPPRHEGEPAETGRQQGQGGGEGHRGGFGRGQLVPRKPLLHGALHTLC